MEAPGPDPDELRALAAKYRVLSALRARRDADVTALATSRATLRELAARHPGCLRELDTLGPEELRRREDAAMAAAAGGPLEPWMRWIWAYHRLMRATLACKRALGRRPPREDQLDALVAEARRIAGFALDADFVRAVAAPPQRRLGVIVFRRLAALYGRPAAEIAAALFPPRRASPYKLEE